MLPSSTIQTCIEDWSLQWKKTRDYKSKAAKYFLFVYTGSVDEKKYMTALQEGKAVTHAWFKSQVKNSVNSVPNCASANRKNIARCVRAKDMVLQSWGEKAVQ